MRIRRLVFQKRERRARWQPRWRQARRAEKNLVQVQRQPLMPCPRSTCIQMEGRGNAVPCSAAAAAAAAGKEPSNEHSLACLCLSELHALPPASPATKNCSGYTAVLCFFFQFIFYSARGGFSFSIGTAQWLARPGPVQPSHRLILSS